MDTARIQETLETCLKHLSVSVTKIEIHEEGGHTLFQVRTPDSGILIGSNGENLRALNLLVRRILEKKPQNGGGGAPFVIDVNGYYSKKVREIKQQAKLLGERARTFKADVEMSPMNSYERMVVHSLFADDPEIYTESVGEGRMRHVVIRYRMPLQNTLSADSKLLQS